MSASLEVLIMMLAFFLLLALGLPVAFGLIGLSIVFTLIFVDTRALYAVFGNLYHVLTNEIYIAIPLILY